MQVRFGAALKTQVLVKKLTQKGWNFSFAPIQKRQKYDRAGFEGLKDGFSEVKTDDDDLADIEEKASGADPKGKDQAVNCPQQ